MYKKKTPRFSVEFHYNFLSSKCKLYFYIYFCFYYFETRIEDLPDSDVITITKCVNKTTLFGFSLLVLTGASCFFFIINKIT